MSDFSKAIAVVIAVHEGGFQNRKDDPGNFTPAGELKGTNFGISAHSFPDVDIANLTLQGAEELYRQTYGMFAALTDQRVLTKVLDLAVNMQWAAHGPATRILQTAVNECIKAAAQSFAETPITPETVSQPVHAVFPVAIDGAFGPATADAANACDPQALLEAICTEAKAHYAEIEANRPEMSFWFKTWNQRAAWVPPEASA